MIEPYRRLSSKRPHCHCPSSSSVSGTLTSMPWKSWTATTFASTTTADMLHGTLYNSCLLRTFFRAVSRREEWEGEEGAGLTLAPQGLDWPGKCLLRFRLSFYLSWRIIRWNLAHRRRSMPRMLSFPLVRLWCRWFGAQIIYIIVWQAGHNGEHLSPKLF